MKEQMHEILMNLNRWRIAVSEAQEQLLDLFSVSNSVLIDYIETEAEVLIPIEEMFNKDGTHITKNEYDKVVKTQIETL